MLAVSKVCMTHDTQDDCSRIFKHKRGRAVAQAVSRRLLIAERRPGFAPRAVYVGYEMDKVSDTEKGSPSPSVFPCQYHSTAAPYSLMYRLVDGQWVYYRPQFHRDIVSPHRNNKRK
jgi:hypothetical protein